MRTKSQHTTDGELSRDIGDQVVLSGLPGFAGGLAVAFGIFAVINFLRLPHPQALPAVIANLFVCFTLTGIALTAAAGRLPARWAHPVGMGLLLLVMGNILLTFSLAGEHLQNCFAAFAVIVASTLLISKPWLAATVGVMIAAWLPLAWRMAASTEAFLLYGLTLLAAVILCLAIHTSRQGIHRRLARAQEELERSELRYRRIFEQSKDIVAISTPDGKLLDINQAGIEVLGLGSKEEARRLDISRDLYADPAQRQVLLRGIEEQGFVKDLESTFKGRDGQLIQVAGTTSTLTAEDGETQALLSILHDVTERKRVEAELDRYRAQLEELVAERTRKLEAEIDERLRLEQQMQQAKKLESLGMLAGGIAHDFNNLVTSLLGHASLLLMKLPADSPYREQIGYIQTAAKRAEELTGEILAFARRGELELEPCHLGALVSEIVDLLRPALPPQATLELAIDDVPPILADATQLRQVVMNLLLNAADALGAEAGTVSLTLEAVTLSTTTRFLGRELAAGRYERLRVTDNGCGMDAETRQKIFDPFFSTKRTGRGLGLASVLGILQGHHGAIEVESEPGQGTTFTVLLPLAAGQPATSS